MKVIADLSIVPLGVGLSLSKYVAACEQVLNDAGLNPKKFNNFFPLFPREQRPPASPGMLVSSTTHDAPRNQRDPAPHSRRPRP